MNAAERPVENSTGNWTSNSTSSWSSREPRRRQMARRNEEGTRGPNRQLPIGTIATVVVFVVVLIGALLLLGGVLNAAPGPSASPPASSGAAQGSTRPTPAATGAPSPGPTAPTASQSASPTAPTVVPSTIPSVTPTPGPGAAPQSASDFDLVGQVIEMGFPLLPETRYHYRDNFLEIRDGPPDEYNHARVNRDGVLVRHHDGIDIYAREGEPLVAPFSGVVIDAATRWQPWEPSRYGNTVVIVSDEPTSRGYVSLFAHMDRVWVQPGTHVTRGQVVGTVGRTGNTEGQDVLTHLHFELRAPFLLDWSPLGEDRLVDAFDAFPSLQRADPNIK